MTQQSPKNLQALLDSGADPATSSVSGFRQEVGESLSASLLSPSALFQTPYRYPFFAAPNSVAASRFSPFALNPYASLGRFSTSTPHLQPDEAIALSAIAAAAAQQQQQQQPYSSAFRPIGMFNNVFTGPDVDPATSNMNCIPSLSSLLSGDYAWTKRSLPISSHQPSKAQHESASHLAPVSVTSAGGGLGGRGPNDDLLQAVKNFFLPSSKGHTGPAAAESHLLDKGAAATGASGDSGATTIASGASTSSSRESVATSHSLISEATFDGTTVLCQVCGDKASGFHYGVHACEGCKGFFRRSIQQKIQYRPCTKNQQCSVLRINRNRCQYCRLKKCIAVGMSRDAVRFGRVPKREKAKILAEMQRANAQSQVSLISAELENEERWISNIITAHIETCEFTRDKSLPIIQRYRQLGLTRPSSNVACPLNPLPPSGDSSQEELSEKYSPAIRGVVNFAKCIPGFHILPQEDQVTLLKAGVFEVLLLRLTILFDTDNKSLVLLNGSIYRRDGCMMGSSSSTSNNGSGVCQGRFLVDSLFDFVDRFNCLCLTDADIAMFCAVVLISPDRPGLRNPELVEKIHDRLKHALRNVLQLNHPTEPSLFGQLVLKIPDLRTLNTLHAEKLLAFKMEPQGNFRFGKESVESSANGSCRSAESSSSAASSRSLRSPMSDVSSCDVGNTAKNHKTKGFTAESSQWSTVCRASESKDDNSSNVSATPPVPPASTVASSFEPPHIQALNLCSSSSSCGGDSIEKQRQMSQQQSVRVISWRTTKECPSLDSGKGSVSSGGESLSDHAHSDNESKMQTMGQDDGRKVKTEMGTAGAKHGAASEASGSSRVVDMPTLKRALLAPPLANFSPELPTQASGSVREKHLNVASLLEKQSVMNTPSTNSLLIPADTLAGRLGHSNGPMQHQQQQQQQQQQPMGWSLGAASNALAAQAFFLSNRASAMNQQRPPTQNVPHHQSSTTPIQQLLNAAAAAAGVNSMTGPILQSPLNYPPTKISANGDLAHSPSQAATTKRNFHIGGPEGDRFSASPMAASVRTSVLAQNSFRDAASPLQYAGAMSAVAGCRSSPKRAIMDAMPPQGAEDDEQPLNLSKKQAVSSPSSEKIVVVGRSPFNLHSVSGLSCR